MDSTETVMAVILLGENRRSDPTVHTEEIDFIRIAPFVDDQAMSAIFPVRPGRRQRLRDTQRQPKEKK